MYEIYLVFNKITQKYYVGQTSQGYLVRWTQHVWEAGTGKGHCKLLYASMNKHGVENFGVSVLSTAETSEEATNLERLWIILLNSRDKKYGYNISEGGPGATGYRHSPESKAKIGSKHRGKLVSQETREKLRLAASAHKHAPEAKAKLSALRGEKANHFDASVSTDDILRLRGEGQSIQQIADTLGTSISLVGGRLDQVGFPKQGNKGYDRAQRLIAEGKPRLVNPDTSELDRLYETGLSCKEIGEIYSMSEKGISHRLRKFGTKMRPKFNKGLEVTAA